MGIGAAALVLPGATIKDLLETAGIKACSVQVQGLDRSKGPEGTDA